jgi:RNase H-like domain found in reverse transcriptase
MDTLKAALTTASALMPIDYSEGGGTIFCGSDTSLDGWGGHLSQEDSEGRRHLSRYESGIWSESERRYDAGKRECRALMKILKKFRNYLYGIKFVVEVDVRTLVA